MQIRINFIITICTNCDDFWECPTNIQKNVKKNLFFFGRIAYKFSLYGNFINLGVWLKQDLSFIRYRDTIYALDDNNLASDLLVPELIGMRF